MKKLTLVVLFCVLLVPVLAEEPSFNDLVLSILETYPTDGSYPYSWSNYDGVTMDITYQGVLILRGHPEKHSYCSGITFEVFWRAYQAYNDLYGYDSIGGMNALEFAAFRRAWYGVGGNRLTIKNALESTRLGRQIAWSEVRKGDFVQIWRNNGSGHTVIFMDWVLDDQQEIAGFEYWSTNSGRGICVATEFFGDGPREMIPQQTYFMRVMEPTQWWESLTP